MFRKQNTDHFCFPSENKLKYTSDYDSVMQFVSKNKVIPAKLEEFKDSSEAQANINKLVDIVANADEAMLSDPVFSDPDCQLYALAALKDKIISILDFLDINIYLTVLMQFTDQQAMKESDMDVRRSTSIKLVRYSDVKQKIYEKIVNEHFAVHKSTMFDEDLFDTNTSRISDFAKMIIGIKKLHQDDRVEGFMAEITGEHPLLFRDTEYYYVYSASLTIAMIRSFNKDYPIKPAPIFGNINLSTLHQLHQIGFHPINLYSKDVITNPHTVHSLRLGPLPTILHDISAHMYLANTLPLNHVRFICEYLIPKISHLLGINAHDLPYTETLKNATKQNLMDLIDLNASMIIPINVERVLNDWFYYIIKYVLGSDRENTFKIFRALFLDKEMIKREYNLDLEEMLASEKYYYFNGATKSELLDSVNDLTVKASNISPK